MTSATRPIFFRKFIAGSMQKQRDRHPEHQLNRQVDHQEKHGSNERLPKRLVRQQGQVVSEPVKRRVEKRPDSQNASLRMDFRQE